MTRQLPIPRCALFVSSFVSSILLGFQPVQLLAQAQTLSAALSQTPTSLIFSAPPPPADLGEPGGRSEAGSRGCSRDDAQNSSDQGVLTALAAVVRTDAGDAVWGLTTAEHPTFWFYVPRSLMSGTGEFVIEDGTNQWSYPVNLADPSGIVQISLPVSSPPLTTDVDYHWYFNIYCQPEQPPRFVHGWIRRVHPHPRLEQELAQATPAHQVELYAAHGIWYDALAIATDLLATNPNDSTWRSLLQSAGLGHLAEQTLPRRGTPSSASPYNLE